MKFSRNSVSDQLAILREQAEKRDAMRRAGRENLPYLDVGNPPNRNSLMIIPEGKAKLAGAAVISKDDKKLVVAVYSMTNRKTQEVIKSLKKQGFVPEISITTQSALDIIWSRYDKQKEEESKKRKRISSSVELEKERLEEIRSKINNIEDAINFLKELEDDVQTSVLLGYILGVALALKVSDVHIEYVTKKEAILRFRIDGTLKDIVRLKERQTRLLVSRVKLLANLKLNIKDAPQDGRFTIEGEEGNIEVRSSMVPAEFGEAIVMRVLDPSIIGLELANLGLRKDEEEIISRELKRPNGMILVTGPTGSGKTTTLYAFLRKVNSSEIKVITIEDPIEYHLDGIEQTQTDRESNYTFATGLRSILRQDPDVILVGEIRDSETAKVSINAALTGHLVFSTLHTNNAAGAIPRLIDLGIKQSTIGPALILVIAQRLARRLCGGCKKEIKISDDMRSKIDNFTKRLPKKISRDSIGTQLYKAVGCEGCVSGFSGRIAITELLEIGDVVDTLIREKATERDIQETAIKELGMVLMQQDGIIKALGGITSIGEIERVTGPIEW